VPWRRRATLLLLLLLLFLARKETMDMLNASSTGGGAAAVAPRSTLTFQVLPVAEKPFGPESENTLRKLTGRKSTNVTAVSLSPLNGPVPILEAADITGDKKKRCGLKQVSFFGPHYVPL
jgi:hypothetical protein